MLSSEAFSRQRDVLRGSGFPHVGAWRRVRLCRNMSTAPSNQSGLPQRSRCTLPGALLGIDPCWPSHHVLTFGA